jgi:hypothetical protein
VSFAQLRLGAPRGEATTELARLLAARQALDGRVDAITREQREAIAARDEASAALTALERTAASGDTVTDQQRKTAEQTLTRASAAVDQPWQERRAGAEAALRGKDTEATLFVRDHLDELLAEVAEDAEVAAEAVDTACQRVLDAYAERMAVEGRMFSLISVCWSPGATDVARTRAEAAAAAASALLMAGGERPPLLVNDPRPPEHERPAVDEPKPEPAAA